MLVIARGKCLELYSKHYPNVIKDGEKVGILEALHEVNSKVEKLLKEHIIMPRIKSFSKTMKLDEFTAH
jgi:hypothetical protein